jgi:hypothetical protein
VLTSVLLLSLAQAPVGQWVWSRKDLAPLEAVRTLGPVAAAVQLAEVRFHGGVIDAQLRLPPDVVKGTTAFVIRFDDSLHAAWAADLTPTLDAALARVLGLAVRTGAEPRVVQLDYDCPTRRLGDWARVVARLQEPGAALAGREVWVTTVPSTFLAPEFPVLFQGHVAGHVAQVFDTGTPWTHERETAWVRALDAAKVPFAIGLGGFERAGQPGAPNASWVRALPALEASAFFRGAWVFCGGQDWSGLARAMKEGT